MVYMITCKPLRTVGDARPMKHVQSFVKDTAKQKLREVMSMSVYCHAHPLTPLRRTLTLEIMGRVTVADPTTPII